VNTASRLENVAEPGQILISYETFALIRDKIGCKEEGTIDVKGIAYPVATYSVLGLHESGKDFDSRFHESRKGISLEIDHGAMSDDDRQAARSMLERAIRHLKTK